MKHLFVALLGLLGDLSFLRLWITLLCTLALTALCYWLALPRELPLWPGVVAIALGAAVGLIWERTSTSDTGS